MQWYLCCLTVLILADTLDSSINIDHDGHSRTKRAIASNFDVLLHLYKLNPLKESNVFKTFSNSILLPRPDGQTPDLNFDSNESTKEKRIRMRAKFKQIEDAIHVTQLGNSIVKRPSLNIQDTIEGDIKTTSENEDFVFPKQENSAIQEYGKLTLDLHDKNDQRLKNPQEQNMENKSYLLTNQSYKNDKLTLYSNGDRITEDAIRRKDEVEVFVMR